VLEKGTPVNEGNQPLRDNGEGLAFGLPLTRWRRIAQGVSPGDDCSSKGIREGAKQSEYAL